MDSYYKGALIGNVSAHIGGNLRGKQPDGVSLLTQSGTITGEVEVIVEGNVHAQDVLSEFGYRCFNATIDSDITVTVGGTLNVTGEAFYRILADDGGENAGAAIDGSLFVNVMGDMVLTQGALGFRYIASAPSAALSVRAGSPCAR